MGKRAQQREETLKRLRATIDELVSEKGFDAVTIREISEKAGVSTGVFYYYFQSKEDILFDRFARAMRGYEELEQKQLPGLTTKEALHAFVSHSIRFTVSRLPSMALPYHKAIVSEYQSWIKRQPDLSRRLLQTLFEKAREERLLRTSLTPMQLADTFWAMQLGARYALLMDGQDFCGRNHLEEHFHAWLDSILV